MVSERIVSKLRWYKDSDSGDRTFVATALRKIWLLDVQSDCYCQVWGPNRVIRKIKDYGFSSVNKLRVQFFCKVKKWTLLKISPNISFFQSKEWRPVENVKIKCVGIVFLSAKILKSPLAGKIPRYYNFVNGLLIYALNLLFDYNEPQGGKVIAAYWQHTCIKYDWKINWCQHSFTYLKWNYFALH